MGEIWALVCRSMAMCVRAMLLCSFIVAFVALVDVTEASAQEKYAGVALQPNGWIMRYAIDHVIDARLIDIFGSE